MFTVKNAGKNRLNIEMGGKRNAGEMKAALHEPVRKSRSIEKDRILYGVLDHRLPSMGGVATGFARLPSTPGWLRKSFRAAVVTNRPWLKEWGVRGAASPGPGNQTL